MAKSNAVGKEKTPPAFAWLSTETSTEDDQPLWIIPSILRQLSSLLLENSPVDRHEPLFNAGSSNIQPTLIRLWRDLVSIK
jgi:hypothetical protein